MSRVFRAALAACVIPAVVLTVGCKKPGLEGKWTGSVSNMQSTLEFQGGGTFKQTSTAPVVGSVEATGTYKIEGEKVNITVSDAKAGGKSVIAMLPPQMKQQSVTFKVDGDSLTLNGATLTRVKE